MLKKGNQQPTFSTVGEWAYSDGDYAISMFGEYGVSFYESQEYEFKVFLARNEDGSYAAKTICISKPRQNGKSYAARFYAVWMAAIEGKRVLFSAHHGKTVRKMFKEIRNFVEGCPDFAAMLKPNKRGVYAAAGSEGIYFVDDEGNDWGLIEFQTRTNSAARGETYQVIIVDEAQELTAEQLEAIKPTTIAADDASKVDSDPQMIYLGTPPNAKCIGTEFRRWHDEAHKNTQTSIWWMEWAVDAIPDMADREAVMELVYKTNPAMGYRIKESTMYDMMDTMSADGFARECLGFWSAIIASATLITSADWSSCEVDIPDIPQDGITTYGVKFAPDGSVGALAAAIKPDEGKPYVQLIAFRSMGGGVGWFYDWIEPREDNAAQIVIDGQAYAPSLVQKLIDADFSEQQVITPKSGEVAQACSMFVDAVEAHNIKHGGQEQLDESATGSIKRKIGNNGGYGFESSGKADCTPIEACALALWAALTTKRDQRREGRVG